MIISGGENVYPREIEEVLLRHPAVLEAAVVGETHEYWGEAITADVHLRPGVHANEQELKDFCGQILCCGRCRRRSACARTAPAQQHGQDLRRLVKDGGSR